MRIVVGQIRVRWVTVPESQEAVEAAIASLGVPWTVWPAAHRWPGGERAVVVLEFLVPTPGSAAWKLVDRLKADGVWLTGYYEEVHPYG